VRVNDLSRSKQGVWRTPHAEKQEDHTQAAIGLYWSLRQTLDVLILCRIGRKALDVHLRRLILEPALDLHR